MYAFFVLQAVLPVVLLLWLGMRRPSGRGDWFIGVVLVFGVIAAVALSIPWIYVPAWVRYPYLAVGLGLALRSWFRVRPASGRGRLRVARRFVVASAAMAAWTLAAVAVDGRRLPAGEVFDLACPLGPGTYLVGSGGSRELVNAHLGTLGPSERFVPWRGQSYGVDLVQVDRFGRRASAMQSPNPSDYLIYGQFVLAPCAGTVITVVDGRSDMPVPTRDPDASQLAGNHVMLACGRVEVLLAHLQPGSVRVAVGEAVSVGDLLGFAGNSGNTDEPHLHVSAQRRSAGQPSIGGDPVWITIDGAFPVRNDHIVCK